ncbi:C40 family peptidase [Nocardia sp. NPDC058058]|uniref:C40 family peptidase n=1 Tax=Nocardia sp. NPDC058058 TaxID=3346317 RepID=UPI0036D994EC
MLASALGGAGTGGGAIAADGSPSSHAQATVGALNRLRGAYGAGGSTGPGTKSAAGGTPTVAGPGTKGGTTAALKAAQLYQSNAHASFLNLDDKLAGYLTGLAGSHRIDQAALTSLIRELDSALITLGPAAYSTAGVQRVHDILTIALQQGIALTGAGQVSAAETAAAIDGLTAQYIHNLVGRRYAGTIGTGASAAAQKAIAVATEQLGKPYVFGAVGPETFDCSGLVQYAARAAGVILPRTSQEQYRLGDKVNSADIKPGDLIFPAEQYNGGEPTHVMMYLGGGECIEAPQPGQVVTKSGLPTSFFATRPRWK